MSQSHHEWMSQIHHEAVFSEHTTAAEQPTRKEEEKQMDNTQQQQSSQPENTQELSQQDKNEQRWWIKQILWPPFPTQNNSKPHHVSILMQNNNGPCSLLAICNVLLLRGSIVLPGPSTRTSISFSSLLNLLSDYLIHQELEPAQLESALSTIPITQTGLDLNPRFASIDGFRPSDAPQGLDLFSAVRIPLVHGWIADSQDFDTWDVIVGKCGDYDKALELVVIGEELLAKQLQNPQIELTQEEQNLLKEALLARKFLDSTSTQLSYPGLFQLATGVAKDSLVTLLRNSHLSVLYRRPILPVRLPPPAPPPLPPPPDQTDPDYDHQTALEVHAVSQQLMAVERASSNLQNELEEEDDPSLPKLFTLVTDLAFLNEPQIVWESLEDVEGGLSEFYDWKLAKSRLKTPSTLPFPPNRTSLQHPHSNEQNIDADLAYQLQEEEYRQAAVRRANQRPSSQPPLPIAPATIPHPAPPSTAASPPQTNPVTASSPAKKKKKDCVIV